MFIEELLMDQFDPYKTTCEQYLEKHLQKIMKYKYKLNKGDKTSLFYRGYWSNMAFTIQNILHHNGGDTLDYVKSQYKKHITARHVRKMFGNAMNFNRGRYASSIEVFESLLNINRKVPCGKTFSLIEFLK